MAYEELVVPAIQRKDVKGFDHRFRSFATKEERDRTLKMIRENESAVLAANMEPVMLRVIVETDENNQLTLDLKQKGG
jgi:hypothetical protein